MKNTKPLVNVATACEKVLVEKDNVFSAIRVIDIFYVSSEIAAIQQQPGAHIPVSALIMLRRGDYAGEGELSLVIETPVGQRIDSPTKWPMLFNEQNEGGNVILSFPLPLTNIGTTWIEVLWNGDCLTRFPVTLRLGQKPVEQSAQS
ncbi:MAG: hypothetical protein WCA14_05885 [Steroidobacteraceae bacterium]